MDLEYKTKELELTLEDLNKYVPPSSPRDLRDGHVERIRRALDSSGHPSVEGVICVNMDFKTSKMTIIDGNHRLTAVRIFLEEKTRMGYKDKKVRATFHIYEGATPKQQVEICKIANSGMPQNKADLIQLFAHDTLVYKSLIAPKSKINFPCNVYLRGSKARNSIKFTGLVEAHVKRKIADASSIGRRDIVMKLGQVTIEDIKEMSVFMEDFIKVWGEPHSEMNVYSNAPFLMPFYKVWWGSQQAGIEREDFVERFRKNMGMYRPKMDKIYGRGRGISNNEELYEVLLEVINYRAHNKVPNVYHKGVPTEPEEGG